jgi:hypothetical protein
MVFRFKQFIVAATSADGFRACRDMTPHPQYVAFYKYLEKPAGASAGFGADAVLHFGMHGTEEWLPGTPLGNTGECWPDILTGGLPNVYVYAANNPSESLLAKRRGYGTLVSHNVPPYSRAGLYKELQTMRGLIADYEETAAREASRASDGSIPDEMESSAAAAFGGKSGGGGGAVLTVDSSIIDSAGGGGAAAPTVEGALIQTLFSAGLNEDMPLPDAALKVQSPVANQTMLNWKSTYHLDAPLPDAASEFNPPASQSSRIKALNLHHSCLLQVKPVVCTHIQKPQNQNTQY